MDPVSRAHLDSTKVRLLSLHLARNLHEHGAVMHNTDLHAWNSQAKSNSIGIGEIWGRYEKLFAGLRKLASFGS